MKCIDILKVFVVFCSLSFFVPLLCLLSPINILVYYTQ
jgi:hypothetical protein